MWMSSILVVIALALVASPVQSLTYHIIPNDTSKSSIEKHVNQTSFTLQQFADSFNNSSHFFLENITLSFAPGKHYLIGGVELNDTASVVIRAEVTNESKPEIACKEKSCFSFINTSSILIENLTFTECYSEDSEGGAIFVSEAKTVNITNCLFVNNFVNRRGGAMRLELIENVHIQQTQFVNNSALPISLLPNVLESIYNTFRCTISSGAISATQLSHFMIKNSLFEGNTAGGCGGAISVLFSSTEVINCTFIANSLQVPHSLEARAGGSGGLLTIFGNVTILGSTFENNRVGNGRIYKSYPSGGAACFVGTTILLDDTIFKNNEADYGGAIVISSRNNDAVILNSIFQNNSIDRVFSNSSDSGGAVYIRLTGAPDCTFSCDKEMTPTGNEPIISITGCTFDSNFNSRVAESGAIRAIGGVLNITGCEFYRNIGYYGGVLYSTFNFAFLQENRFIDNIGLYGGTLFISTGILISRNDQFTGNEAEVFGGAIVSRFSYLSNRGCVLTKNKANSGGGAVFLFDGAIQSVKSHYESNSASHNGGALFVLDSTASFSGDTFCNNDGDGTIFDNSHLFDTEIFENQAFENNQIYTIELTNVRGNSSNLTFSNNVGSINLFYSTLNFSGSSVFTDNIGVVGGALTLIQSTILLEESSTVYITGNNATYGGGIFLSQSNLVIQSLLRIENNTAADSGGGIYDYQSYTAIETADLVLLTNNRASEGGGMYMTATSINIFIGTVIFTNNKARRGGAVSLYEGSKIYIQKTVAEEISDKLNINLTFSNNSADFGGALYVDDNSNSGVLCNQATQSVVQSITSEECFIQTLRLYFPRYTSFSTYNYINVFFSSNTAHKLGNDIFGGLLDRCQINAFAEIHNLEISKQTIGITYLKAIAKFEVEIDYNKLTSPSYNYSLLTSSVTKEHVKDLITSDAVQLCFCINSTYDCSYQWPEIFVRHGEPFSIRAVTVDQVENPVNGKVQASVLSSGTRLMADQSEQTTFGNCTDLTYKVFSTEMNTSLIMNPNGPCGKTGISSRKISITFLDCDCPKGLRRSKKVDECECECDDSLDGLVSNCQLNDGLVIVVRERNDHWIQYVDNLNDTGFFYQKCPYDYCLTNPVNLSVSLPLNVDEQCAFNRSGIMCGECEEGLSLVFGSSRCLQCSNNYLTLLITFAFAGIALVVFILFFNLTVAVGTIHGLILYANIVGANSPVFLPPETALHFFVSWVNLDVGIETCFFDGMDTHAKVLLQLVFPIYIISLSMLIVGLSTYWGWFARFIGRKNPIATLCTLFLLSYSKLLRTTIAGLQFTELTYPNGSYKLLWLFNPNIPYFTPSRIPFLIISIIIIVFGTIHTMLLLFGHLQCLKKVKKLARYTQNSRYNAFKDAHHAPFVIKCRYWIGILLLFRIIHHFLSAILNESIFLLMVSCLVCVLWFLKQAIGRVYKNWLVGLLETSYLINLLLFSVSTYYVSNTNGDQVALANISVSIAFITFIGIVFCHAHSYVLKSLKIYRKLILAIKRCLKISKRKMSINTVTSTINSDHNEGTTELSMQMDVLREPALDIIAPVTKQDYRKDSTPVVPSSVTSTIVWIED